MRMNEGVEWAVHICLLLAWLETDEPVPTARLAASYDLPAPYLNKQLQALVRAGIATSTPGKRGGFRLTRPLQEITLMDVVTAIEGPDEAFQCTEIRKRGINAGLSVGDFAKPCTVKTAMRRAEMAWRRALAEQNLADIKGEAERTTPGLGEYIRNWYART
jgi:Rrf2 family protein